MKIDILWSLFFIFSALCYAEPDNDAWYKAMKAASKIDLSLATLANPSSTLAQKATAIRAEYARSADPIQRLAAEENAALVIGSRAVEVLNQQAQKQFDNAHDLSWENVRKKFPDSENETSGLRQIAQGILDHWGSTNAPILKNPNWPMELFTYALEERSSQESANATAMAKLEAKWAESLKEALVKFPEVAVEGSPLNELAVAIREQWYSAQDPRLAREDAPMILYSEAQLLLNRQKAAQEVAVSDNNRAIAEVEASQQRQAEASYRASLARQQRFESMQGLPGPASTLSPRRPVGISSASTSVPSTTREIRTFGNNATDQNGNTYRLRNIPGRGNLEIEGLLEIRGNTGFAPDGSMLRKRVDSAGNVWFEP